MLYLEDYLELIEHLPQELRDRLTLIRENDLKVNNTRSHIDITVEQFFAQAKNLSPEQRQCDYEKILSEYEKTTGYADEKVQLSDQTHDIMIKLVQKLDGELEKFKLELEADHAGITEELERRSLELDAADTRLEETIRNQLNGSVSHSRHPSSFKERRRREIERRSFELDVADTRLDETISNQMNGSVSQSRNSSGFKDRRRSEHKQDHGYQPTQMGWYPQLAWGYHPIEKLLIMDVQMQQGKRSPSLKANFAPINGAGSTESLNCKESRNALAPMAPDQQAYRFNQQYGKLKSNGNSSPLCVSVTKSGRPSKRPKHHASHLYPDESPPSISSDNSVFENSESMSSADFIDAGNIFGSSSPSSFEFHNSSRFSDQSDGASRAFYHQPDQTKYCICRQVSYGEMVACDNETCEIEWFHYGCVGVTHPPKGDWFCPDCTQKMNLLQQLHNSGSQPTQTQKKRGRKEILGN